MISDPASLTAELNDPQTPAHRLVEIAGSYPEFGSIVAEHPNASLDVLSYLLKHGDDVARRAAARRRARDVALITTQQAAPSVVVRENVDNQYTVPIRPLQSGVNAADHESRTVPLQQSDAAPEPPRDSIFRTPAVSGEHEASDETRIVTRSQPRTWRIEIDGQAAVVIEHEDMIVGRKPVVQGAFADAVPVAIPDPTKTLSKVHARLVLREAQWFIIDLGATNGVLVETPQGDKQIAAGEAVAVSSDFVLGDLRMRIVGVT